MQNKYLVIDKLPCLSVFSHVAMFYVHCRVAMFFIIPISSQIFKCGFLTPFGFRPKTFQWKLQEVAPQKLRCCQDLIMRNLAFGCSGAWVWVKTCCPVLSTKLADTWAWNGCWYLHSKGLMGIDPSPLFEGVQDVYTFVGVLCFWITSHVVVFCQCCLDADYTPKNRTWNVNSWQIISGDLFGVQNLEFQSLKHVKTTFLMWRSQRKFAGAPSDTQHRLTGSGAPKNVARFRAAWKGWAAEMTLKGQFFTVESGWITGKTIGKP